MAEDNLSQADVQEKLKEVFTQYEGESHELIPILQEAQKALNYLPAAAIKEIGRFLHLPESTIYGVSTFYAQFKLKPQGRRIVKVCRGTACHVRGGARILAEVEKTLGIKASETTDDLEYSLESIACFGSCALAPVVVVDDEVHGRVTTSQIKDIISGKK